MEQRASPPVPVPGRSAVLPPLDVNPGSTDGEPSPSPSPSPASTPSRHGSSLGRFGSSVKSKKWVALYQKAAAKSDPYSDFDIEHIPAETAIRHFYDPQKNEWRQSVTKIKLEPKAFGKGAMRSCYRMKKLSNWVHEESWLHASDYVAKCYTKTQDPEVNRTLCLTDIKAQQTAKLFAELYNKAHPPKAIDMMQVFGVELTDRPGNPFYCVERYLEGEYIKYNSNVGYTDERRNTPQAFSHFTFEKSGGRLLVVDIQGVGDLYTDPQIHSYCEPEEFGEGNLGIRGYVYFFHTHKCNHICEHLGLKPFEHYPGELNVTMSAGEHSTTAWRSAVHFAQTMRQRASALGQTVSRRLHSLMEGPATAGERPAPLALPISVAPPTKRNSNGARSGSVPKSAAGAAPAAAEAAAGALPAAPAKPPTHHSPFHKGLICVGILTDMLQGLAAEHRLRGRLQAAADEVKSILEELTRDDEPAAAAAEAAATAAAAAAAAGSSSPPKGAAGAAGAAAPAAGAGQSALAAMIAASRDAGGAASPPPDASSDATSNASASVSRSDLGAVVLPPNSPYAERLLPDGSPALHGHPAPHHTLPQVLGLVHRQLALMYDSEAQNPNFVRPADDALPKAVIFHYEKAAEYGCVAAQLALANALAGLPTSELANAGLGRDAAAAFRWAHAAAELGSRVGAIKAARALEAGEGAPRKDYAAAAAMYERAAGCEKLVDDDVSGSFELEVDDHELWAAVGALHGKGGHGLGEGPAYDKAQEAYLKAAEAAEAVMKAKKAATYYALAEQMEANMG
eukprot:tig00021680_g23026.t1